MRAPPWRPQRVNQAAQAAVGAAAATSAAADAPAVPAWNALVAAAAALAHAVADVPALTASNEILDPGVTSVSAAPDVAAQTCPKFPNPAAAVAAAAAAAAALGKNVAAWDRVVTELTMHRVGAAAQVAVLPTLASVSTLLWTIWMRNRHPAAAAWAAIAASQRAMQFAALACSSELRLVRDLRAPKEGAVKLTLAERYSF